MITRPLNLQSHLRVPSHRLNLLPLLDIFFIGLFFAMLASNFVLAPGLTINLPEGQTGKLAGLQTSAVLTVQSDEMLFFQERILNLNTVKPALEDFVARRGAGNGQSNLLIYFDRSASVQTLMSVAELAREAGVARVQLAAEPRDSDSGDAVEFR